MTLVVVVGTSFGDEGKGRIVADEARNASIVLRANGGCNAGHSVQEGEYSYALSGVPSGIVVADGPRCFICRGCGINPISLMAEIEMLTTQGLSLSDIYRRLRIDKGTQLIFPYHQRQDALMESWKKEQGRDINTTKQGIGPMYADKAFRTGLRAIDMMQEDFLDRVEKVLARKNVLFGGYYEDAQMEFGDFREALRQAVPKLTPLIGNTIHLIRPELDKGATVVGEMAQGTFLDLDYGGYPDVTSSHPTTGGLQLGTGITWKDIAQGRVIGVTKAYETRVGNGKLTTEDDGEFGKMLAERGREWGTVTGRKRRCGALDLPRLLYAHQLNAFTELAVTKLDILDELEQIPVCRGYEIHLGQADPFRQTVRLSVDMDDLAKDRPVYDYLAGWRQDTTGIQSEDEFPPALTDFLGYIENFVGVPVKTACFGPKTPQRVRRPDRELAVPVTARQAE